MLTTLTILSLDQGKIYTPPAEPLDEVAKAEIELIFLQQANRTDQEDHWNGLGLVDPANVWSAPHPCPTGFGAHLERSSLTPYGTSPGSAPSSPKTVRANAWRHRCLGAPLQLPIGRGRHARAQFKSTVSDGSGC